MLHGLGGAATGTICVVLAVLSLLATGLSLSPAAGATSKPALITDPFNGGVAFGNVAVGTTAGPGLNTVEEINSFYLSNNSGVTVTIDLSTGVTYTGPGAGDYTLTPSAGCPVAGNTMTLTPSFECLMEVFFRPSALGDRSAQMTISASDGTMVGMSLSGTGVTTFTAAPSSLSFGETTLGTFAGPDSIVLTNAAAATETINLDSADLSLTGPGADDYAISPSSDCPGDGVSTIVLAAGAACTVDVSFLPGALGDRSATMTIEPLNGTPLSVDLSGTGTIGYYQVDAQGNVESFGDAADYGDASTNTLSKPIVGMAQTGDDGGYWLVATDGGIFSYGDAQFYGSTGGLRLNKPIVGMAPTSDDGGYWLVASDGGIFSYGDAQFYGSTGGLRLNKPIVGMAATPDGQGYWLVATDGGIFSYGDAQFHGSAGSLHLSQPIVSMAAMPDGLGYWLTAADGGVFNYGDAPFLGSGARSGQAQVVDMTSDGGPTVQANAGIPAVRHVIPSGTGLPRSR